METTNMGIKMVEMLKRYMIIKETNVFGSYEDEVKYIRATELPKYMDEETGGEYLITIVEDKKEFNEAIRKLMRSQYNGLETKVIITPYKVKRDVKDRLRDIDIEVFDETAEAEVSKIVEAFRRGLNLPNFGRGRFKFQLTHCIKYTILDKERDTLDRSTAEELVVDRTYGNKIMKAVCS